MPEEPHQGLAAEISSLGEVVQTLSESADKLQSLADRGAVLCTLLGILTAPSSLDSVSDLILTHALDGGAVGESGSVFVVVPTGERTELERLRKVILAADGRVVEDSAVTEFGGWKEGEGIAGHVLQTGRRYVATDCGKDKRYKHFSNASQLKSLMAAPLKYRDRVMGVLCVHTTIKPARFSEDDEVFVQALANIASIVVRANYSDLTILPNRELMNELAEREVALAAQGGRPLSVAYLDIDDFGALNRAFGHATADEAIKQVARAMANETSQGAMLCHCHGDEFAIIFRDQNAEQARATADRIRERVAKSAIKLGNESCDVTISVGVAGWEAGMTSGDLIDKADEANGEAKCAGKNRVKTFSI